MMTTALSEPPAFHTMPPIRRSSFSESRSLADQTSMGSRRSLGQSILFKPCSLFPSDDEVEHELLSLPHLVEQETVHRAQASPAAFEDTPAAERRILAERPRAIAPTEYGQPLPPQRSTSIATSSVTASRTNSVISTTPSNHSGSVRPDRAVSLEPHRRRRAKQRSSRATVRKTDSHSTAPDTHSASNTDDLATEDDDVGGGEGDDDENTSDLRMIASSATDMPVVPGFDQSDSEDDILGRQVVDDASISSSLRTRVGTFGGTTRRSHDRANRPTADQSSCAPSSASKKRPLRRRGTSESLGTPDDSGQGTFLKRISGRITSGRISGRLIPVRRQSVDARYYSESPEQTPRHRLRAAVKGSAEGLESQATASTSNCALMKVWHNAIRCEIKDICLALATAIRAGKQFSRKDEMAFVIWWKQFEDFTGFIFHLEETYVFESFQENGTVNEILTAKARNAAYQKIREQMKFVEGLSILSGIGTVEISLKECTNLIISHLFLVEATFPRMLESSKHDVESIESMMMAGLRADSIMEQVAFPMILRAVTNPRQREQLLQASYPGIPNRLRIRYWQKRLAKEHLRHIATLSG